MHSQYDPRLLALELNEKGDAAIKKNLPNKALRLYKEAIYTFEKIPYLTTDDWRRLASYQCEVGNLCKKTTSQIYWYKKAIGSLEKFKPEWIDIDWINLANSQHNIANASKKPNNKLFWHKKAIMSLNHVNTSRNNQYWRAQAGDQLAIAKIYKNGKEHKDFVKAQTYLDNALGSFIQMTNRRQTDYAKIAEIYKNLYSITFVNSFDEQLYLFASNIFSDNEPLDFENQFYKLDRAFSLCSFSQAKSLHLGFIQLMQLINTGIDQNYFPNKRVRDYLSIKPQRHTFEKILIKTANLCRPQSLLNAVSSAPNLEIAIVERLLIHDKKLDQQGKRIEQLTQENKEVSTEIKKTSIYQTNMPIFNKSAYSCSQGRSAAKNNAPNNMVYDFRRS